MKCTTFRVYKRVNEISTQNKAVGDDVLNIICSGCIRNKSSRHLDTQNLKDDLCHYIDSRIGVNVKFTIFIHQPPSCPLNREEWQSYTDFLVLG